LKIHVLFSLTELSKNRFLRFMILREIMLLKDLGFS
jgi:hypothetical protein